MILKHTYGTVFSRTLYLNKDISRYKLTGNIIKSGRRYPLIINVQEQKKGTIIISSRYIETFAVGSYKYSIGYSSVTAFNTIDTGTIEISQTATSGGAGASALVVSAGGFLRTEKLR